MRRAEGWYEEDCDWAIVATVYPTAFTTHNPDRAAQTLTEARRALRNWLPDAYERYYGVTLGEGESLKRDEAIARERHADDLVVVSAWGSWAVGVPDGMVGVHAQVCSRQRVPGEPTRYFLIPQEDYENIKLRCALGFVVDPAKYAELTEPFRHP
jgi:hypothetical protein